MIRLDATTIKLQAVLAGAITTTQPQAIVCYSDKTTSGYAGGSQRTVLNSTTDVDIALAPAVSTVRDIDYISIYNRDTVSITVTVKYDVSATDSTIITVTLATLETLQYVHGAGWACIDAQGRFKTGAQFSGTLPAVNGGTGFSSYTVGDILYADTTTTLAKLADVAAGSFLRSGGVATAPVWSTTIWTNSAAQGDLLFASATNTYTNLVKDTNATRYLSNTGTSNNPAWAQVALTTGVTGTLPVGNGGTGAATFTAHGILLGETASAIVATAAMTDGQLLVGQTSADPLPKTVSGYGTMAASGALTVTKVQGTTTNNNATAGDVGEFVSSTGSLAISNNTVTDVTSISLTAGDWDVHGAVVFTPAATTNATIYAGSINTTSATLGSTTGITSSQTVFVATFLTGGTNSVVVNPCRISIASTTTVYLAAYANFSVSTMSVAGVITARRAR